MIRPDTMRKLMRRHVSGPARALLTQAELLPETLDLAIDATVSAKEPALLRRHHPLVQHIAGATGINIVHIARRSRHLLIEIEQHNKNGPSWQYRERTPTRCAFFCRGELPASIGIALQGALLEDLVAPVVAAIKGTFIEAVGGTGDGWLHIDVQPPWYMF